MASRYPKTLNVLRKHVAEIGAHRQTTIEIVTSIAGMNPERLCQELFDTVMEQAPIEDLDTDVLLELILRGYEVGHLQQLPKLHRLARKIEAVHRAGKHLCSETNGGWPTTQARNTDRSNERGAFTHQAATEKASPDDPKLLGAGVALKRHPDGIKVR
ncbi:hypothetical protein [Marinobacter sp.]|uniref:hypothetical protein n=1 Tax=Marinobacter sp. TaxID=50741 RepID=UPI00384C8FE3